MNKFRALFVALLGFTQAMAIDFQKTYFESLEFQELPLVKAIDMVNKIHSGKSNQNPEFTILLEDPINMKDPVTLSLKDVSLNELLNVLLSGTEYHFVTSGKFLIIKGHNNLVSSEKNTQNLDIRDSVCSIVVDPSVSSNMEMMGYAGTGSGFLCKIKGVEFLVTNIHVIESANYLSDIKVVTRDNLEVILTDCFVAQDRDICIFRHKKDSRLKYLDISKEVSKGQQNDSVYLMGYPLGGGTLLKAEGTLEGIGSTLVELNCSAFSGNSGGPVLSTTSNEVLGALTFVSILDNNVFTDLARKKLGNPFKDDLRVFATRVDTISDDSWEPLIWSSWREHKKRSYMGRTAVMAFHSLVKSNYKPGTLIADEKYLVQDPSIWRAYKKCAEKFDRAVAKKNYVEKKQALDDFINFIEIEFRPITGLRWKELNKPWRYNWFKSRFSGNVNFYSSAENIKRLFQAYHNDWKLMKARWELPRTQNK